MITVGSITRADAAQRFPFLAARYSGRRKDIKEFTHRDPDFVFWIFPDGRLTTLVVSDNADLYGTVADLRARALEMSDTSSP